MNYSEVAEKVDTARNTGDTQMSLGQNGPETLNSSKVFVQRLDIHDVITIQHPDGANSPVAVLCKEAYFHTNGMIQSESEIIFFSDYAEGFVAIQNLAGRNAEDMDPLEGIPDTIPGTASQGAGGAQGRDADFDPPFTNHSARPGSPGANGAIGAQGREGFTTQLKNDGMHANDITIFVKNFEPNSVLEISAVGGNGGRGAQGGPGGKGQKGGTGGQGGRGGHGNAFSPAKTGGAGGVGGRGGTGGTGGQGGPGGDGGNGGDVLIYALEGQSLGIIEIINNRGGSKGSGGDGGDGGEGGNGGNPGKGGNGGDGSIGRDDGKTGLAGSPGSRGPKGARGRSGEDGAPGIDGDVRYEARKIATHVNAEQANIIADRVLAVA